MITVSELIKALSELPGDTLVVVQGYEGGYSDASLPSPEYLFHIALNVNAEDNELEPHEESDDNEDPLAICM